MIILIEIIVVLGLIAFPFVKYHGGVADFMFNKGIIFGFNLGSTFFQATLEGENGPKVFELKTLQFHLFLLTVTMSYSKERPDIILDDKDN